MADSTCLTSVPSIFMLTGCVVFLFLALKIINRVFFILRESLLALNHSATFFSSSFVVVINVLMSECELNILVSSAKRINESNVELL